MKLKNKERVQLARSLRKNHGLCSTECTNAGKPSRRTLDITIQHVNLTMENHQVQRPILMQDKTEVQEEQILSVPMDSIHQTAAMASTDPLTEMASTDHLTVTDLTAHPSVAARTQEALATTA